MVDRWQLDSKTWRFLRCFLAKANWEQNVITILVKFKWNYSSPINHDQGRREGGGQGGTMTPGPMDFRKPIEMTLRNQHMKPDDLFFFFWWSSHLISTGKTVRILVKTFFFNSHHFSDQTTAFSPSISDFTKSEICHIWAGPGPTFGPWHHWLWYNNNNCEIIIALMLKRSCHSVLQSYLNFYSINKNTYVY